MSDTQKIVPRIIETSTDNIPSEVVPGTIILDRDTDKVSFDASDGVRHEVSGGGSSAQPDYQESDESSPSFIKNKPFYKYDVTKLSGNIIKNPTKIDSYTYVCDIVGITKDQSEDIMITLTNPDNPSETMTVQGHVGTINEMDPDHPVQGPLGNVIALYHIVESEYGNYPEPILIEGVEYGPDESVKISATRSVTYYENIAVNTIDICEVKYLDPLFIKPYRPDYSETDPNSPNYISNKVIEYSTCQKSVESVYLNEGGSSGPYGVILGYGLARNEDNPSASYEYRLNIKFKDGTSKTIETYNRPLEGTGGVDLGDETEEVSFLLSLKFTIDEITVTVVSGAGWRLGPGLENETAMLCFFDAALWDSVESFTLFGYLFKAKLIPLGLVKGLEFYLDTYHDQMYSFEQETETILRGLSQANYVSLRNVKQILHDARDLTDYLNQVTLKYGNTSGEVVSDYATRNVPFYDGLGTLSYPFEILATTLVSTFSSIQFEGVGGGYRYGSGGIENYRTYVRTSDSPLPNMYLKLVNAENIDGTFRGLDLTNHLRCSTDIDSRGYKDDLYKVDFCLILCHDITNAEDTFSGLRLRWLCRFKLSGDSSLGRRVKIYGTNRYTFSFHEGYSDDYERSSPLEFVLENLEFMDSIYFNIDFVTSNANYMVNIIDQLHDYSLDGGELPTDKFCTFGSAGMALLSEEQIKVATDKGWKIN